MLGPLRRGSPDRLDGLIVLDGGKGIVEVMQQPFPLLVRPGLAESFGMVLERAPAHQEQIPVRFLEAAAQLVRKVAWRRRDDALRLPECRLELAGLTGLHIQYCRFQDHRGLRSDPDVVDRGSLPALVPRVQHPPRLDHRALVPENTSVPPARDLIPAWCEDVRNRDEGKASEQLDDWIPTGR